MNGYALAYLGLVLNQLLSALVFLALYITQPGWRSSAVGRHITYWVGATCVVDLSWLALLAVRWSWLVYVLFGAQALVGLVGWQRVWLVWRARS